MAYSFNVDAIQYSGILLKEIQTQCELKVQFGCNLSENLIPDTIINFASIQIIFIGNLCFEVLIGRVFFLFPTSRPLDWAKNKWNSGPPLYDKKCLENERHSYL